MSSFLYETDVTFSINIRRLPLSIIVGINNIRHTFPIAFIFIISESVKSFKFIEECLTDLCFYDYP
jgi:hypothetical protein